MKSLFRINIFTYIFLILTLLSGYLREMFIIFIILIVHELGHFFLMKLYKIDVKSITIYPYGGMIKSNMLINTNSLKVIIISLGGIIIQLLLFFVFFIGFKIGIVSNYYYDIFMKFNMSIIIFNMLPIYPLDGFKIVNSFLELIFSFKKSVWLSLIINLLSLIIFIIYLYIFKINNYVIVIFLIISLISYIRNIKYIFNKFYIERIIYNLDYKGLISVNNKNYMFKNKYNYICGIGEKEYLNNFN